MSKKIKSLNEFVSKHLESKKAGYSSEDSDSSDDSDTSESLSLSSSDEKYKSKSGSKKYKHSKKKKKKKSSSKKKKRKHSSDSSSDDSDEKSKKYKKKKRKQSKEKLKDKDDKEALHRKLKLSSKKTSVEHVLSAKRRSSLEDSGATSKKAKLDNLDVNEAIRGAIEKEMTTNASQAISEILDDILGSERSKINEKKLFEDSLKNITIKKEKEDDVSAIKIKKEKVDKLNSSREESATNSNKNKTLPVKLNRSRKEPADESDSLTKKIEKSKGKENKSNTLKDKSDERCERKDDRRDDKREENETIGKEDDVALPPVADVFVEDLLASQAASELVKTNTEKPQKPGKITIGNLKQPTVFKQVEAAEKQRRSKFEDGEITPSDNEAGDNENEADDAEKTKKDKRKKRSTRHRKYRAREKSRSRSHDRSSKGSSYHHSSASSRSRHRYRGSRSRSLSPSRDRTRERKRDRENERDRSRERERDRTRERDRQRRSRRRHSKKSRSRSLSLSLSPELRRKSKSPIDSSSKIDKKKLLEIARKNAATMMAEGMLSTSKKFDWRMAGKSVNELTDFCKSLSRKGEEGEESSESESSAESVEAPFHHPFEIKQRPDHIVMNIKNAMALKTRSFQEKTVESSKQLSLQFPVSSGSQHRRTESEWVPVSTDQPAIMDSAPTLNFSSVATPGAPPLETAAAARAIVPPVPQPVPVPSMQAPLAIAAAPPSYMPAPPPVFSEPDPDVQNMDIGSVVSQRLKAMRRLAENPNDSEAQMEMYNAQKKMKAWAESKQMPGQFTGSTEVRILTPQQLAAGSQAWVRKEQFETAVPVSGGMGMHLLQKMGWQPGQGLGKNMEGSLEPLNMEIKLDKRGLVAKEELPQQKRNPFVYRRGGMGGPPVAMGRGGGGPPPGPRKPMQMSLDGKHPVSLLHEFCMRRKLGVPQYVQVSEDGPPHKRNFVFKEILPLILATRQPRKSSCIAQNLLAQSRGEALPHSLEHMENETIDNHARNNVEDSQIVDHYENFENDSHDNFNNYDIRTENNTYDNFNNYENSTENYLPSSTNTDYSNDIFKDFSSGPRENDRYHYFKSDTRRSQFRDMPTSQLQASAACNSLSNNVKLGFNPQFFPSKSSSQSRLKKAPLNTTRENKTNVSSSISASQKNSSNEEQVLPDSTIPAGESTGVTSDFPHRPIDKTKLPNPPEDVVMTIPDTSSGDDKVPDSGSTTLKSSRRKYVKSLYYTRNRTALNSLLTTIMSQSSLSSDDLLAISEIYEARKCLALGKKLFHEPKILNKPNGKTQNIITKPQEKKQEAHIRPLVNEANPTKEKKTEFENQNDREKNIEDKGETRNETHGTQRDNRGKNIPDQARHYSEGDKIADPSSNPAADTKNVGNRFRLNPRNRSQWSPQKKSKNRPSSPLNDSKNRLNRSPSPRLKNRTPSPILDIRSGPIMSPPRYNIRHEPNRPTSPTYNNRRGLDQSTPPLFDIRHIPSRLPSPPYDIRHRFNRSPSPRYNIKHGKNRPPSPRYDIRHEHNRLPLPPYDIRHRINRSPSPYKHGQLPPHETHGHHEQPHQKRRSPSRLSSVPVGMGHPNNTCPVESGKMFPEQNKTLGLHDKCLETSAAAAAQVNLENCAPSSLESGEIESGELTDDDEDNCSISQAVNSSKREPKNQHLNQKEPLKTSPEDPGRTKEKDFRSRHIHYARCKVKESDHSKSRNVVGEYKPPDVEQWLETNFNATPTNADVLKEKCKTNLKDEYSLSSSQNKDPQSQKLSHDKSRIMKVCINDQYVDKQPRESVLQSKKDPVPKTKNKTKITVESLKKAADEIKTDTTTINANIKQVTKSNDASSKEALSDKKNSRNHVTNSIDSASNISVVNLSSKNLEADSVKKSQSSITDPIKSSKPGKMVPTVESKEDSTVKPNPDAVTTALTFEVEDTKLFDHKSATGVSGDKHDTISLDHTYAKQSDTETQIVTKDMSIAPSKGPCEESNQNPVIKTTGAENSKIQKTPDFGTVQKTVSVEKSSNSQKGVINSEKSNVTDVVLSSAKSTSSPNKIKKSSIFKRLDPLVSSESKTTNEYSEKHTVPPEFPPAVEPSHYENYHSEGEISLSDEDSIYSTSHLIPDIAEMMLQEITPLMEVKVPTPENAHFSPSRYDDHDSFEAGSPRRAVSQERYSDAAFCPLSPGRYSPPRRRSLRSPPHREKTHSLSPRNRGLSRSPLGRTSRFPLGSPPQHTYHSPQRMSLAQPSPTPERIVRRSPTPEEIDLRTYLQILQTPALPRQEELEPVLCEVYEAPSEDNRKEFTEDYVTKLSTDFARKPLENYTGGSHEDYGRDIPENYLREPFDGYASDLRQREFVNYHSGEQFKDDGQSPRQSRAHRSPEDHRSSRSEDYYAPRLDNCRPNDQHVLNNDHSSNENYRTLGDYRTSRSDDHSTYTSSKHHTNDCNSNDRYLSDHHLGEHSKPKRRFSDSQNRKDMSGVQASRVTYSRGRGATARPMQDELFNPDNLLKRDTTDLYNQASTTSGLRGHSSIYRGRGSKHRGKVNLRRGSRYPRRAGLLKRPY